MLRTTVLPRAKLWEYFSVDVEAIVKEFKTTVCHLNGGEHARPEGKSLVIIQDTQYRRLGSTVDAPLTLELFNIFQYVNTRDICMLIGGGKCMLRIYVIRSCDSILGLESHAVLFNCVYFVH